MEQFSRFAAPATSKLRQLQKIVQDISNNEDSLLNKWRRHRVKHGPKLPDRDYPVDHFEDTERWSDESDYEEPPDADGYEDPPAHQVFTPSSSSSAGSFSRDNYVDSCRRTSSRLSRKPWPSTTTKPPPPEPWPSTTTKPPPAEPWPSTTTKPPPAEPWTSTTTKPPPPEPWTSTTTKPPPPEPWPSTTTKPPPPEPWPSTTTKPPPPDPWTSTTTKPPPPDPWPSTTTKPPPPDPWTSTTTKPPPAAPWTSTTTKPPAPDPWTSTTTKPPPPEPWTSTTTKPPPAAPWTSTTTKPPPAAPWTSTTTKPPAPQPGPAAGDNNEDYIDPERSHRDNNVKPAAAKPLQSVNSSPVVSKPLRKLPCSPVVYEVTRPEENIPPVSRQTQPLQTKLSTRLISPRVILEQSDTEFEAFDPDISQTIPKMSRGHPPPPKAFTADFRPPMIPLQQKPNSRRQADLSLMVANGLQDMDMEKSDIDRQPWYANTCGRKTAEELLIKSNRDGSFLVRRSTGQDPQQPYTLVVLYKGRVYNIPVRFIQATQHYALGREKRGQQHFSSVSKIIENHLQNPLVLIDNHSNSRDITNLRHPVGRSQVVPQR
ncbi:unnamed protein product [Boreogadus saida]